MRNFLLPFDGSLIPALVFGLLPAHIVPEKKVGEAISTVEDLVLLPVSV